MIQATMGSIALRNIGVSMGIYMLFLIIFVFPFVKKALNRKE